MGVLVGRRFLNLILAGCSTGVKSLRRINLAQLFYRDTPPPSKTTEMETLRLPHPSFTLRGLNNGWNLNCFPFADSKVICGDDQSGLGFIFDLDTRKAGTMPPLPKLPTVKPVSVFAHKPHVDDDRFCHGNGSSLFLMERVPQLEPITNEVWESQHDLSVFHGPTCRPTADRILSTGVSCHASAT
jgi:hypothetical protein